MKTRLTSLLNIQYPIIMAPMFLVSNVKMLLAGIENGIAACIPALNFRTIDEFKSALNELDKSEGCYGVNLIVNSSNNRFADQLDACLQHKPAFIITSLGSPSKVIDACKKSGIKVFCDVSTMEYAYKAASLKPDGLIAVNNQAGGHLGPLEPKEFITHLHNAFPDLIIISAGGVGTNEIMKSHLEAGADGVSVGTIFIPSEESPVCLPYKQACVDYGKNDIVITRKLSGIPCTVINTPYMQQIGIRTGFLTSLLNKNKRFKKWIKTLRFLRGMKILQRAAFDATYQNVWCAGQSIQFVNGIKPVKEIIRQLIDDKPTT